MADEYTEFTVAGGVHLDGRLTLGENTADNGGLRIAHMALESTIKGQNVPLRDGFTPEQRLFLGWGQIWCQTETEESAKLRAQVDPHSPGRFRVNGVVVGETTWDARLPERVDAEIGAGVLREGANSLELENVGDTGAAYSMVFLDRFTVRYPRTLAAARFRAVIFTSPALKSSKTARPLRACTASTSSRS